MSRRRRLAALLRSASDDDAADYVLALRYGFEPPGGTPSREWDRLHGWQREIIARGDAVLAERQRTATADVLATTLVETVLEILAPLLGVDTRPDRGPQPPQQSPERAAEREARASELAGKIRSKGGVVPGEGPEAHPLGITVREV